MSWRARAVLAAVAVTAVVVTSNVWAFSSRAQVDLSSARRFSLADESEEIARAVDDDLDITVFLAEGGGAARDARFLLARYRELNRHIDYQVVDPDERPAEARRYDVTGYNTVVVEYRGRRVDAISADELELSSAILRALRGRTQTVCLVTGHGEASLDDDGPEGLSSFADLLEHNAFAPRELDLASGDSVPGDCAVVVLAGARVPLLPNEVDALVEYTEAAGRLMVLATPLADQATDPNRLLQPWGIAFAGGLVVDPARSQGLDVANVIVEDFPTTNPVVDGVPRLQFPVNGGLLVEPDLAEGLSVSRLAVTSDESFVETTPDDEISFGPGDFPGPVVVAAAADDSRVDERGDDDRIVRTRVLATGNAEWATNRFLGRLGNRRFMLNALAWLTEEEQVLTVASPVSTTRELPWTAERRARVIAVAVVGVPGAVLLLGLGRWLLLRRRLR